MELILIIVAGVVVLGAGYWYLHKKNPDLAQDVTDTLVEGIKEDTQKTIDQVKDKVDGSSTDKVD